MDKSGSHTLYQALNMTVFVLLYHVLETTAAVITTTPTSAVGTTFVFFI